VPDAGPDSVALLRPDATIGLRWLGQRIVQDWYYLNGVNLWISGSIPRDSRD